MTTHTPVVGPHSAVARQLLTPQGAYVAPNLRLMNSRAASQNLPRQALEPRGSGGAEICADETWSALHCVGLAGQCDASEFE